MASGGFVACALLALPWAPGRALGQLTSKAVTGQVFARYSEMAAASHFGWEGFSPAART